MVLVDANVLLYAVNSAAAHHGPSLDWLERALGGRETVGFAWAVLLAFLRLGTNPAVLPAPLAIAEATDQVSSWLAAPAAVTVEPTSRHATVLAGLLAGTGSAGNLVGDAHLAALAIEHDAEIVTFDRDFDRFAGVHSIRPN
ncbi:MAG: type II toxin-antitoxin system VapC family toxin [Solirubrobacteraceae bacterium]|nr:type II toxin-antitoxin system VapC family toxin [Solirubrobacteraceae bacterium]